MEYLGAWGTLIHEKNLKSKISCQTPFKSVGIRYCYVYLLPLKAILLTNPKEKVFHCVMGQGFWTKNL